MQRQHENMNFWLFLLGLVIVLPGCATPYQTVEKPDNWYDFPYGVRTTDLGGGIYNIYVNVTTGVRATGGRELALAYFERRREEISKETGRRCETLYVVGFDYYAVRNGGHADGRIKCIDAK